MSRNIAQNRQSGLTTSAKVRANNVQIREFLLPYSGPVPAFTPTVHDGHKTSRPRLDLGEESLMYAGRWYFEVSFVVILIGAGTENRL